MVSAVFVRVAAPRTKSSLRRKSSRNLGSMAKISLHALSILKKHMNEFLGINFGRFCRSTALMINCYVVLSHSTAQRWSRGHKARGQGQGHKKNPRPRPRPRTAFPRTDTLEAKDKNARGQGQGPRTQAQVLSKKKKKKVFTKIF